jgi:esterase
LFLRGERSDYVQPAHQSAILGLFPRAVTETLSGAGHWLHAEAPDRFIPRACAFLLA